VGNGIEVVGPAVVVEVSVVGLSVVVVWMVTAGVEADPAGSSASEAQAPPVTVIAQRTRSSEDRLNVRMRRW
jgi:hypothetical protein